MLRGSDTYADFESKVNSAANKDDLSSYIKNSRELGAMLGDWKNGGPVNGLRIADYMQSSVYGVSRTPENYKSIFARFGNAQATQVDESSFATILGNLQDAANDYKDGTIDIQKYLDIVTLRGLTGGEELWSRLINGQTVTAEDYNKVISAYQAMEEADKYRNEDFYSTLSARLETARGGTKEQREALSSEILGEIVSSQEAGYYIGQLQTGKTIGDSGWQYITSALGQDWTKERFEKKQFSTG